MSKQDVFIFEISKESFNTSVLQNSQKIPVFVEFMGVWSEPCIRMSDTLAALAREFAGQFIFAKIDSDEQSELCEEHGIKSLPTLKVFKDGEVVSSIEGLVEEDSLRDLLKSHGIFHQSDELRLQAREKHIAGNTAEAIQLLTHAIQLEPGNTRVAMDMVQVMIDLGELEQATGLFNRLPDSEKESDFGRALIGQLSFMQLAKNTQGKDLLLGRLASDPKDLDACFDLAICHIAVHEYEQAADRLFQIMEIQSDYKDGAAREMLGNMSNMLTPNNPQMANEIRRRLGNILS